MRQRLVLWFLLTGLLTGCMFFERKSNSSAEMGEPLARVGNEYLYKKDIETLALQAASAEDSIKIVSEYIDSWIRQQLMYRYAQENLPPEQLNIDKLVEDYRQSLLIYTYERVYVEQNLDTLMQEDTLLDFYYTYIDNFILADDLVKLQYVKVGLDAPKQDSIGLWLNSSDPFDRVSMEQYLDKYAIEYNLQDSMWYTRQQLMAIAPFLVENYDLSAQRLVDFKESPFRYFFLLQDFKIKESRAPFEYVKPEIKRMILNQRQMRLRKEFNDNIYKDAAKNNTFEVYR